MSSDQQNHLTARIPRKPVGGPANGSALRAPSFPGAIWPVRTEFNHSTHSARHKYLAVPQHRTRSDDFELSETRRDALIANGDAAIQNGRAAEPINQHRMWNPFWLHRGVLLVFCCAFFLMIMAVAALYIISQKNQGLSTQTPQYRYLWTYGPTASKIYHFSAAI